MVGPVQVPQEEVVVKVSRSGGPGGQHANTSETRVELAWDVTSSPSVSEAQRTLLLERLGPVVRAVAEDTRSQARNRDIAFGRLAAKVAAALIVARTRRPTRPSRSAVERRLTAKRRTGERKRGRRGDPPDD
jgi:ribosome-associated protein